MFISIICIVNKFIINVMLVVSRLRAAIKFKRFIMWINVESKLITDAKNVNLFK